MTSTHASALCLCLTTDEDDCLPACLPASQSRSLTSSHSLTIGCCRILGLTSRRGFRASAGRRGAGASNRSRKLQRFSFVASRCRRFAGPPSLQRARVAVLVGSSSQRPSLRPRPWPSCAHLARCTVLCCVARSLIHSFFKVRPREGTTNRCTLLGGATEPRPPSFVYICRSRRVTKQLKGKK